MIIPIVVRDVQGISLDVTHLWPFHQLIEADLHTN